MEQVNLPTAADLRRRMQDSVDEMVKERAVAILREFAAYATRTMSSKVHVQTNEYVYSMVGSDFTLLMTLQVCAILEKWFVPKGYNVGPYGRDIKINWTTPRSASSSSHSAAPSSAPSSSSSSAPSSSSSSSSSAPSSSSHSAAYSPEPPLSGPSVVYADEQKSEKQKPPRKRKQTSSCSSSSSQKQTTKPPRKKKEKAKPKAKGTQSRKGSSPVKTRATKPKPPPPKKKQKKQNHEEEQWKEDDEEELDENGNLADLIASSDDEDHDENEDDRRYRGMPDDDSDSGEEDTEQEKKEKKQEQAKWQPSFHYKAINGFRNRGEDEVEEVAAVRAGSVPMDPFVLYPSPKYQSAYQVVDDLMAGQAEDGSRGPQPEFEILSYTPREEWHHNPFYRQLFQGTLRTVVSCGAAEHAGFANHMIRLAAENRLAWVKTERLKELNVASTSRTCELCGLADRTASQEHQLVVLSPQIQYNGFVTATFAVGRFCAARLNAVMTCYCFLNSLPEYVKSCSQSPQGLTRACLARVEAVIKKCEVACAVALKNSQNNFKSRGDQEEVEAEASASWL